MKNRAQTLAERYLGWLNWLQRQVANDHGYDVGTRQLMLAVLYLKNNIFENFFTCIGRIFI